MSEIRTHAHSVDPEGASDDLLLTVDGGRGTILSGLVEQPIHIDVHEAGKYADQIGVCFTTLDGERITVDLGQREALQLAITIIAAAAEVAR